jgi:hypothetical protein
VMGLLWLDWDSLQEWLITVVLASPLARGGYRKLPPVWAKFRYLAPVIYDASQAQWSGIVDAAQKRDVNLICFPGECWAAPRSLMKNPTWRVGLFLLWMK